MHFQQHLCNKNSIKITFVPLKVIKRRKAEKSVGVWKSLQTKIIPLILVILLAGNAVNSFFLTLFSEIVVKSVGFLVVL